MGNENLEVKIMSQLVPSDDFYLEFFTIICFIIVFQYIIQVNLFYEITMLFIERICHCDIIL